MLEFFAGFFLGIIIAIIVIAIIANFVPESSPSVAMDQTIPQSPSPYTPAGSPGS